MVLDVDLNSYPDGVSEASLFHNRTSDNTLSLPSQSVVSSGGFTAPNAPINVDDYESDDEVVFLFESKKANRSRRADPVIINVDADLHPGFRGTAVEESTTWLTHNINERSSSRGEIINCGTYETVEANHHHKRMKVAGCAETPTVVEAEAEDVVQREPILTCVICLNQLEEETSTICGHLFCLECIKKAIKTHKKCPTCRRKLNMRNVHRIYLPTPK